MATLGPAVGVALSATVGVGVVGHIDGIPRTV